MHRILWAFCAAVAVIGLAFFMDEPVSRFFRDGAARYFLQFPDWFSKKGIFLFYTVFILLYLYARVARNSIVDYYCRVYIKTQLVFSFALVRILKIAVGRPRPGYGEEFTFFSLDYKSNSFPSGHAADIFVGGLLLFMLIRQSRWRHFRHLPLLYAALVGIGRVAGGWHYMSDVVAGAMIGIGGVFFFLSHTTGKPVARQQPDQF